MKKKRLPPDLAHPKKASELPGLVKKIETAHAEYLSTFKKGLGHALEAGTLLLQCREIVGHGHWGSWLAQNVKISERSCQRYLIVARHKELVEALSAKLADLTLAEAEAQIGLARRELRLTRRAAAKRAGKRLACEDPHEIVASALSASQRRLLHAYLDEDSRLNMLDRADDELNDAYFALPSEVQMLVNSFQRLMETGGPEKVNLFLRHMWRFHGLREFGREMEAKERTKKPKVNGHARDDDERPRLH